MAIPDNIGDESRISSISKGKSAAPRDFLMVFNLQRKSTTPPSPSASLPIWLRILRVLGITVLWIVVALLIVWATAAIYVDCRVASLRIPLTVIYISGIIAILVRFKGSQ